MRSVKTFVYWSCLLAFTSCTSSYKQAEIKGDKLTICSPCSIPVESFICEYDTIKLEASDHSLLSGILQIHLMNDKLYITDSSMGFVSIYSLEGRYIAKICNQGEGPKEYLYINSFETDSINNRLLLTDSFSKRLFEYDEWGNLLHVVQLDFPPTLIASDKYQRYVHLNSGIHDEHYTTDMKENNVHIINDEGKIIRTFLPDDTPQRMDIRSACAVCYTPEGEILYMPFLSNTIYRLTESEAVPVYTLYNQTGYKDVTPSIKKSAYYKYNDDNIEELEQEGYLLSFGSFLASDSLMFVDLGWGKALYAYCSLSDGTSVTVCPQDLKGNTGLCEIFSTHPKAISGNTLYIAISPEKMQYALPLLPEGKLKTFFTNMTDNDNPCIIAYRINKELFQPSMP